MASGFGGAGDAGFAAIGFVSIGKGFSTGLGAGFGDIAWAGTDADSASFSPIDKTLVVFLSWLSADGTVIVDDAGFRAASFSTTGCFGVGTDSGGLTGFAFGVSDFSGLPADGGLLSSTNFSIAFGKTMRAPNCSARGVGGEVSAVGLGFDDEVGSAFSVSLFCAGATISEADSGTAATGSIPLSLGAAAPMGNASLGGCGA